MAKVNSKIEFHENIAVADIAFTVKGKDLNELFTNAAIALTSSVADISQIKSKISRDINLENSKIDLLLFDFLDELVFYKDTEGLLFSKFDIQVTKNSEYKLIAVASGETADPKRHKIKIDIKAITMHMFEVKQMKNGYSARIVIDI